LACVLICCAAVPRAQADSPFSCPAPRPAVRQKTAPLQEPSLAAGGKIDLFGDTVIYGTNGKGSVHGHVTVHQGQRTMKSDDAEYEDAGDQFAVQGKVDYEDPLIHVTGFQGHYSSTGGASFKDAQFELARRYARYHSQTMDIAGISAPVLQADGHVIGSIGVIMPASRFGRSVQERLPAAVIETARKLGTLVTG